MVSKWARERERKKERDRETGHGRERERDKGKVGDDIEMGRWSHRELRLCRIAC